MSAVQSCSAIVEHFFPSIKYGSLLRASSASAAENTFYLGKVKYKEQVMLHDSKHCDLYST
jgi:hypothetical protein